MTKTRVCRDCGREYPLDGKHFYATGRPGGFKPNCADCVAQAKTNRRLARAMPTISNNHTPVRGRNRAVGSPKVVVGLIVDERVRGRFKRIAEQFRAAGITTPEQVEAMSLAELKERAPFCDGGDWARLVKSAVKRRNGDLCDILFASIDPLAVASWQPWDESTEAPEHVRFGDDSLSVLEVDAQFDVGSTPYAMKGEDHPEGLVEAAPPTLVTIDDAIAVAELVLLANATIKDLEKRIPQIQADYAERIVQLEADRDTALLAAEKELAEARVELAEAAKMMGVQAG